MARRVQAITKTVNPKDDVTLARQRAMGMVTQSDQDLRISRLETIAQSERERWQFITSPWYYRGSITQGGTGFYFTTVAIPSATSTFAGVDQKGFISPVAGYVCGCYVILNKVLSSGSIAGGVKIRGADHVFEESRIFANVAPLSANSFLAASPTSGVPIARGEELIPGLDGKAVTSATAPLNAQIVLIIAFRMNQ